MYLSWILIEIGGVGQMGKSLVYGFIWFVMTYLLDKGVLYVLRVNQIIEPSQELNLGLDFLLWLVVGAIVYGVGAFMFKQK